MSLEAVIAAHTEATAAHTAALMVNTKALLAITELLAKLGQSPTLPVTVPDAEPVPTSAAPRGARRKAAGTSAQQAEPAETSATTTEPAASAATAAPQQSTPSAPAHVPTVETALAVAAAARGQAAPAAPAVEGEKVTYAQMGSKITQTLSKFGHPFAKTALVELFSVDSATKLAESQYAIVHEFFAKLASFDTLAQAEAFVKQAHTLGVTGALNALKLI